MKKIKNYKVFLITTLILIIVVSFLLEILIGNIGVFRNNINSKDISIDINDLKLNNFNIEKDQIVSNSQGSSFILNLDKKYIDKFKFTYSSSENVEFKFIIKGYNSNNKKITIKKDFVHSKYTNLVSKKIGFKVTKIKIIVKQSNVRVSNIMIDNTPIFNSIRFMVILLSLTSLFCVVCYRKFEIKSLTGLFVVLSILIGSAMIIASPVLAHVSWDEAIHYKNTNNLFRGKTAELTNSDILIMDTGLSLPSTLEENQELMNAVKNNNQRGYDLLVGTNMIRFNDYIYIPIAVARRTAEIIGFNPLIQYFLGKVISLLLFVSIMAYAIHTAKVGKTLLFTIGLLPISLFQAVSYSRDSLIIACIAVSLVVLINLFVDEKSKVNFKFVGLFTLPLLIACLAKANYFPLFLLGIFIPKDRFENKKQKNIFKLLIILITILVLSTFAVEMLTNGSNLGDSRGDGHVNVAEQTKVVLNNPINFLNIFIINAAGMLSFLFSDRAIASLAYLGSSSYFIGNIFSIVLLLSVLLDSKKGKELSKKAKILIMFFLLVLIFGISLAMYLQFTPVGANRIDGVQPRYYLPLIYPFMVCLITSKIKENFKTKNIIFTISLLTTIAYYIIIFELYIWKIYW